MPLFKFFSHKKANGYTKLTEEKAVPDPPQATTVTSPLLDTAELLAGGVVAADVSSADQHFVSNALLSPVRQRG